MQSQLLPAFPLPVPSHLPDLFAARPRALLDDPARPRTFLDQLSHLVSANLDYHRQPSPGQSFRFTPASSSSTAPADFFDDRLPAAAPVYSTSSDNGDAQSTRFVSQSPTSSPPRPFSDSQAGYSLPMSEQLAYPQQQQQIQPPAQSSSERVQSLSTLFTDRYSRLDRFSYPERRATDPPGSFASTHFPTHSAYATPSYALHRVTGSSGSAAYSDLYGHGSEWPVKEDPDARARERTEGDSAFDAPAGGMPRFSPRAPPYVSPVPSAFSGASSASSSAAPPSPRPPPLQHAYSGEYAYDDAHDGLSDGRPGSRGSPFGYAAGGYAAAAAAYAGDAASRTYSFVALPGNNVRKRPRRRYDEIERLYACNHPGCTKAYGTLNHLNAHVNMQKHGAKRHPNEFKELRKHWRKMKKEQEQERGVAARRRRSGGDAYAQLGGLLPPDAEYADSMQPAPAHFAYGGHAYASRGGSPTLPTLGRSTLLTPLALTGYSLDGAPLAGPGQAGDAGEQGPASAPSPPPLNRLPPDSTLLTPLHPAPAFHPSLPLPRDHGQGQGRFEGFGAQR